MVKVNLGTRGGLRMNMPQMSPNVSGKVLKGWVWVMDEAQCGVGIRLDEDNPESVP